MHISPNSHYIPTLQPDRLLSPALAARLGLPAVSRQQAETLLRRAAVTGILGVIQYRGGYLTLGCGHFAAAPWPRECE
jgi:hypothetical protein